jgi:hypothetical protein
MVNLVLAISLSYVTVARRMLGDSSQLDENRDRRARANHPLRIQNQVPGRFLLGKKILTGARKTNLPVRRLQIFCVTGFRDLFQPQIDRRSSQPPSVRTGVANEGTDMFNKW